MNSKQPRLLCPAPHGSSQLSREALREEPLTRSGTGETQGALALWPPLWNGSEPSQEAPRREAPPSRE